MSTLDNATDDNCTCSAGGATQFSGTAPIRIKFLTDPRGAWVSKSVAAFEALYNHTVVIDFVSDPVDEFTNDLVYLAKTKSNLFDGYVSGPGVLGSIVPYNGWADLQPFITETAARTADWQDILLGYRAIIATYQNRILMYPLDGDLLSLFYRKDILQHFNLTVPRTWQEYSDVARAVHGQTYRNRTLTGSCVGRGLHCANAYWANLILASMTQTSGARTGHLLDTKTFAPLTGAAMERVLELLQQQVAYGADDELEKDICIELNTERMVQGDCVMTYNWGNTFKRYLEPASTLGPAHADKFGVAPTPGSTLVLDRSTGELVPCDEELCKDGRYYEDIGWVNLAPYMAYGGWSCAVNNYPASALRQRLAMEFCAFSSSKQQSMADIIPLATGNGTVDGQDPFRRSHLDVERYVAQGYGRAVAKAYVDNIEVGLGAPNVVQDIWIPHATEFMNVLDAQTYDYLNRTKYGLIEDPARERQVVVQRIDGKFRDLIAQYDADRGTGLTLLQTYQKLRGVYVDGYNFNYLGKLRIYGFVLLSIILLSSLSFGLWAYLYRKTQLVRASQPFFLVMICVGTTIFGLTLIPLGIDDGSHSVEAAGKACMSIPWLLALGWTIIFSALFSKLWRINLVYKSALRFRRVQIHETDVLMPFAILFTVNVTSLLVWTVVDPIGWNRTELSETESSGNCASDTDSVTWKVCFAIVATANVLALCIANIEAFRSRHVATEYGESRYIAIAMGSILQIVLVGVPLLFIVSDNTDASFFIESSMVFIVSMSILLLIFVPKVMVWWRDKGERLPALSKVRGSGIKFKRNDQSVGSVAEAQGKLDRYVACVAVLEDLLKEQGFDTNLLWSQAGLREYRETQSTDAAISKFSSMQNQPSTGPVDRKVDDSGEEVQCEQESSPQNRVVAGSGVGTRIANDAIGLSDVSSNGRT